jgi:hypothetical protein
VKLELGTPAGSTNKVLRGAAVPSGASALEIRYVVVVLRDAVDEARFLGETQPFKRREVLARGRMGLVTRSDRIGVVR